MHVTFGGCCGHFRPPASHNAVPVTGISLFSAQLRFSLPLADTPQTLRQLHPLLPAIPRYLTKVEDYIASASLVMYRLFGYYFCQRLMVKTHSHYNRCRRDNSYPAVANHYKGNDETIEIRKRRGSSKFKNNPLFCHIYN